MVLVMKLTTFAWNVYDGRQPVEVCPIAVQVNYVLTISQQDLDKWQNERRVTDARFPSFLAFLGYAFYFPGFLVGPFLEYAEYDALVSEKLFSRIEPPEHLREQLAESRKKRAVPPGRKRVAYNKMFFGLGYLGLYVFLFPKFNYGETVEPWFLRKSLLQRFEIRLFSVAVC